MGDQYGLVTRSCAALMDFFYLRFHVIPLNCLPRFLMKLALCGSTAWSKHISSNGTFGLEIRYRDII